MRNFPNGKLPMWGQALPLGQTSKVAAWEIAQLGSCHLRKFSWEVAAWEKSVGKEPNK